MPIRFVCESCGARVKVPEAMQGRRVRCPGCGHTQVAGEGGAAGEAADAVTALGDLDQAPTAVPVPRAVRAAEREPAPRRSPDPREQIPPTAERTPAAKPREPVAMTLEPPGRLHRPPDAVPPEATPAEASLQETVSQDGGRAAEAAPEAREAPAVQPRPMPPPVPRFLALLGAAWLLRLLGVGVLLGVLEVLLMDPAAEGWPAVNRLVVFIFGLALAALVWGVGEMAAAQRATARRLLAAVS